MTYSWRILWRSLPNVSIPEMHFPPDVEGDTGTCHTPVEPYALCGVDHNTPEEILEAVKEKLYLMNGGRLSEEDLRLQRAFRKLFAKYTANMVQKSNVFPYGPLHGLVSSVYLRQYRTELEAVKLV